MGKKKKVYFISPNSGALGYYRSTMPAYYLHHSGLAETAVDFGRFQKEFVDWADIIVVQRVLGETIKHMIHYSHMKGKKVVFDLDDNVWKFPDSPEFKHGSSGVVPGETTEVIRSCDGVTVSTQAIADSVRKEAGDMPISILPNSLDFSKWKQLEVRQEHFLVGWAGGHYHVQDLEMIVPGVKTIIDQNKNVTLVFLGCCPMQLLVDNPGRVFLQEFVNVELFVKTMAVMRFDIGLAPLFPTEFAKSRSNLRLLQYSALAIPTVLSDWGEYGRLVDEGFPAIVANNGDWGKVVQELIDDSEKRIELGERAKEFVMERYEIRENIPKWIDAYNEL